MTGARIGSQPASVGAQNARHGYESQINARFDRRRIPRQPRIRAHDPRDRIHRARVPAPAEARAKSRKHVGLSEFHFNRLFRRWTGLTPKQYLAEVTSRAARQCAAQRSLGARRRALCRTFGRRAAARSDRDAGSHDARRDSRAAARASPFVTASRIRPSARPSSPRRRAAYVAWRSSKAPAMHGTARAARSPGRRRDSCATTRALRLWSKPSGVTKLQHCRSPCAAPTSRCRSGAPCSN